MEEDIKVLEEILNRKIEDTEGTKRMKQAIENLINRNKELEKYKRKHSLVKNNFIPKSKVREKIEILEKCTTNIDRKVNLTDYMIIGETERAVGRFVNLDFIKKVLLEEPGYDIELLQEGDTNATKM